MKAWACPVSRTAPVMHECLSKAGTFRSGSAPHWLTKYENKQLFKPFREKLLEAFAPKLGFHGCSKGQCVGSFHYAYFWVLLNLQNLKQAEMCQLCVKAAPQSVKIAHCSTLQAVPSFSRFSSQ